MKNELQQARENVENALDYMAYAKIDVQFNQELYFEKIMHYIQNTNPFIISQDYENGKIDEHLKKFIMDSMTINFGGFHNEI